MKNYFLKRKAQLNKQIPELRNRIQNSTDANEVRELGPTLQGLVDELAEVEAKLAELEEQENNGGEGGQQQASNEDRGVNPFREFRAVSQQYQTEQRAQAADRFDTVEYRTAFMHHVCRNVPMPAEMRADAVTGTADAGAVIPTTYMNEIVREMGVYGEILNRCRRMHVQGGVEFPVLDLMPTATWISADTGTSESDAQKLQANDTISFKYHGLECKIAQTLLASVTTLSAFQDLFVKLAAEAMVKALEIGIFNGTGVKQMLGITKDTRVKNVVTMSPTDMASWAQWKKKVFGKMKKAYRKGAFYMAQGTFDGYIDGMVDDNGQPIARVNYGIADGETYRFGGKEVTTVENDVIADYEAAATGDVIGVFVDLSAYGINTNLEMQVVKWIDHDTNTVKNKAIMICDGKLIDASGVIIIKKGAAS